MSYNLQYMVHDGEPIAKYVKTIPTKLTGFRFGEQGELKIEFCISGDDPVEDYENSVLEVYTEKEFKYIQNVNKPMFREGFVKPYDGTPVQVNTSNYMSDDEVMRIASLRRQAQLEEAIEPITSYATLNRILLQAQENGLTKKLLDLLEAKMAQVKAQA